MLGSSLALSLALGKFFKKIALGLVASVFMDDMYMVLNYCSVLKKRLDMRRSMVLAALAASKVAKKKLGDFEKKSVTSVTFPGIISLQAGMSIQVFC